MKVLRFRSSGVGKGVALKLALWIGDPSRFAHPFKTQSTECPTPRSLGSYELNTVFNGTRIQNPKPPHLDPTSQTAKISELLVSFSAPRGAVVQGPCSQDPKNFHMPNLRSYKVYAFRVCRASRARRVCRQSDTLKPLSEPKPT